MNEILTMDEAAQYLKVNKETLYKKARARIIPCQKIGNLWRFHREILDEWIKGKDFTPVKFGSKKVIARTDITRGKLYDEGLSYNFSKLAEPSFAKVWNNEEDSVYDKL